jgi:hypothetical protein
LNVGPLPYAKEIIMTAVMQMFGYSPDMKSLQNDPLADAMWDFHKGQHDARLDVTTDVSLPEEMEVSYFFREFHEMNEMERIAMERCKGRILDVGAGAGCHSIYLQEKGMDITSLESSERMTELLKERGLKDVIHSTWQKYSPSVKFDHILLLMNGLGMAEKLNDLPIMMMQLSSWLSEGGEIILDSSDIGHLYELEDGSRMTDLGGSHEGEIVYTVGYRGNSVSFPWLYVTQEKLHQACQVAGLQAVIISEIEESYLASIKAL